MWTEERKESEERGPERRKEGGEEGRDRREKERGGM